MQPPAATPTQPNLTRFAWLSIAAALATIALKGSAYLVAAIVALIALTISTREPDEEHAYGHTNTEYFSSRLEGALIFIAALGITASAIPRLIQPQPWSRSASAS